MKRITDAIERFLELCGIKKDVTLLVIGGIAVYRHRAEIEKVVKDISAQLDAREEDGFFTADLGGDDVIHTVEHADAPAEEQTPEGEPPAADSEDFVDA